MDNDMMDSLQVVWEVLNAALYDVTEGNPDDAEEAINECLAILNSLGVAK